MGGVHRKGLVCIFPLQNEIEESQHPLRDGSFFYGLSHGLKIARQLSIFTPVFALVPPFRARFFHRTNKKERAFGSLFFIGTVKGTRTPDLLIRSQSLYPTELLPHASVL